MRWTLMARETNALEADGEVAWSSRFDAGVKVAGFSCERGWQKCPVTAELLKPLRGECRVFPE
jgi:hypothetical protein